MLYYLEIVVCDEQHRVIGEWRVIGEVKVKKKLSSINWSIDFNEEKSSNELLKLIWKAR